VLHYLSTFCLIQQYFHLHGGTVTEIFRKVLLFTKTRKVFQLHSTFCNDEGKRKFLSAPSQKGFGRRRPASCYALNNSVKEKWKIIKLRRRRLSAPLTHHESSFRQVALNCSRTRQDKRKLSSPAMSGGG
jgi:hypothetical protein